MAFKISTAILLVLLVIPPPILWAHQRNVVPRQAALYRATVIREVRFYWGMAESPAMFMGQIAQESGFKEDAKSAFASGLTQFTKPTAEWIQGLYARDLRELCAAKTGCPLEPKWAIRAMVLYDKRLWNGYPNACGDERKAFMLSGYNGGDGWTRKERAQAIKLALDPDVWFGSVETVCLRAAWACKENRDYPRRILLELRHHYEDGR